MYLPRIKPQMWGTPQDIQYAVKENSGKIYGINPDNIVLAMPMFSHAPLLDYGKFGNKGTNYGATWKGQDLSFDGADDSFICNTSSTLDNLPALTVIVNQLALGWGELSAGVLAQKGTGIGVATGWLLSFNAANRLFFRVNYTTTALQYHALSATHILLNISQMYAVTWTGANALSGVTIYSNGRVVSQQAVSVEPVGDRVSDAGTKLYVGSNDGLQRSYYGIMASKCIFNTALTADQVALMYNRPWGLYEPVSRPVYFFQGGFIQKLIEAKYDIALQKLIESLYDIALQKQAEGQYDILLQKLIDGGYDIHLQKTVEGVYDLLLQKIAEAKYDIWLNKTIDADYDILAQKIIEASYDLLAQKTLEGTYDIQLQKLIEGLYDILTADVVQKLLEGKYDILARRDLQALYDILVILATITLKSTMRETISLDSPMAETILLNSTMRESISLDSYMRED